MKKIAILGSTGSIGVSTLKVIEANPGVFSVNLLAAESNANLIFEQCQKFNPRYVYLKQDSSAKELKDKLSSKKLNTSVVDEDDLIVERDENNNESNNFWKSGWSRISFDASIAIIK